MRANTMSVPKKEKKERPFGIRDKVGYLFGDFGCNMSFQLISSYLMLYMTQGMGLSTEHWAIIVVVAKIFDAINDPIIGALVDARRPGKNGKFRPWIFWGAFAIAITTLLLFIDIRGISYGGRFAYCLIMYMVWSIAYTAANVPYGSLNAALTDDPGQRASLSSLRSIGAGVAMLPIMVVLPLVVYGEKDPVTGNAPILPEVFIWVALLCGLVGIGGFMLTYFLTKERSQVVKPKEKFNYFKTFAAFLKNRAALGMCLASFAQLVFVMSYSTTLPLVFQFYFQDTNLISIAVVVIMIPMMLLIPFMGKMSVKFGKKEISTWPNLLSIVVLIVMLFVPFPRNSTGAWIYSAMLGVTMFAGGTFMLATWSMVADCVDQQELNTGKREEGSVYATYSLARKIAQGVGAGFVALCLGWCGYDSQHADLTTPETASNMLQLSIILPLVGFVIVFLALLFVYNLNRKKVEENVARLREIHAAAEQNAEPAPAVASGDFGEIFENAQEETETAASFKSAIGEDSTINPMTVEEVESEDVPAEEIPAENENADESGNFEENEMSDKDENSEKDEK